MGPEWRVDDINAPRAESEARRQDVPFLELGRGEDDKGGPAEGQPWRRRSWSTRGRGGRSIWH